MNGAAAQGRRARWRTPLALALTALYLGGNSFDAGSARVLAPTLGKLTALQVLGLDQDKLGDAGINALLPALRHLSRLTRLLLNNNNATSGTEVEVRRALQAAGVKGDVLHW